MFYSRALNPFKLFCAAVLGFKETKLPFSYNMFFIETRDMPETENSDH